MGSFVVDRRGLIPPLLIAVVGVAVVIGLPITGFVVAEHPETLSNELLDVDDDGISAYDELFIIGSDPLTADTDGDGLADGAELRAETDLRASDTDDDGLTDSEEIRDYGTDPTAADTDEDGLTDSEEITEGTDPLAADTDQDGVADGREIAAGTDPLQEDTDGDGVNDAQAIAKRTDSDGDGLNNYEERTEYDTDPSAVDTDDDGLTDFEEVREYGTDPRRVDTDDDGLDDAEEVTEYNTDPRSVDTDTDGVTDTAEVRRFQSDPTVRDTDGDGVTDGEEIRNNLDPTEKDTDGDGYLDYYAVNSVANLSAATVANVSGPSTRLHLSNPLDSTAFSGSDSDGDGFPDRMETANDNLSIGVKDVIVRVNWASGHAPATVPLLKIQDRFAESPVDDGAGIRLHFYIDAAVDVPGEVTESEIKADTYYNRLVETDDGTHNLLYVQSYSKDGRSVAGATDYKTAVISNTDGIAVGQTTMHELGHAVGLTSGMYTGIDSTEQPADAYPSVMNYNGCPESYADCYTYSSGTGHDDWGAIEERLEAGTAARTGEYDLYR